MCRNILKDFDDFIKEIVARLVGVEVSYLQILSSNRTFSYLALQISKYFCSLLENHLLLLIRMKLSPEDLETSKAFPLFAACEILLFSIRNCSIILQI